MRSDRFKVLEKEHLGCCNCIEELANSSADGEHFDTN